MISANKLALERSHMQFFPLVILIAAIYCAALLIHQGVFSRRSLHLAPQRANHLGLIHAVLAAAVFYGWILFLLFFRVPLFNLVHRNYQEYLFWAYPIWFIGHWVLIVLLVVIAKRGFGSLQNAGLTWPNIPSGLRFGVVAFLLTTPILAVVTGLSHWLYRHGTGQNPPYNPILLFFASHPPWPQFIMVTIYLCLWDPLIEELLFRGIFQTTIANVLARWRERRERPIGKVVDANPPSASPQPDPVDRRLAILITAAIFAASHLYLARGAIAWMPAIFIAGCVLGFVYERTGNLCANWVNHCLLNTFALVLFLSWHR